MIDQHVERGAGVTVAAIPVPREEATAFGVIRVGAGRAHDRGLPGEARRPAARCPAARTWRSPRWASTSSAPTCWWTPCARTRPTTSSRHDMGGDIVPMLVRRARRRSTTSWTTRCPAPSRATRATGATSGRWTPTSTRTWTCARCTRSSTCTTTGGRSSRTCRPSRRPSSCTTAATGSAARSTAWSATA